MPRASSRNNGISVETTTQGLPIKIYLAPEEINKGAAHLESSLLRLCKQAYLRGQIERRALLRIQGIEPDVIDSLGYAKPEELAECEEYDDACSTEPFSWLQRK